MEQQAMKLLGRGLSQVVVANALGCTEGYISQLMSKQEFAEGVAALKLAVVEKDSGRAAIVNEIKDALLEKTRKALPMMLRPLEILAALKVIDGLKCGDSGSSSLGVAVQQVVQVNLPAITMQNFIKNNNGEIVEVSGRSLATLAPVALKNMMAVRFATKGESNECSHQVKATETLSAATAYAVEAEAA